MTVALESNAVQLTWTHAGQYLSPGLHPAQGSPPGWTWHVADWL